MNFWDRVDERVLQLNTTYTWVCARASLQESTVSMQRKRGIEPRLSDALRIGKVLGLSLDVLATGSGPDIIMSEHKRIFDALIKLPRREVEAITALVETLNKGGEE